jgi:hypothetical protein
MNVVARQWYYMLEHNYGDISAISWPRFKALCQEHFEPPLTTNHISDLVHLPFGGSMVEYYEVF